MVFLGDKFKAQILEEELVQVDYGTYFKKSKKKNYIQPQCIHSRMDKDRCNAGVE